MKICEHGDHYGGKRCRKHAKVVIGYRVLLGKRVSPTGPDQDVYTERVTFRCPAHTKVKNMTGKMSLEEYDKAISTQEPGRIRA